MFTIEKVVPHAKFQQFKKTWNAIPKKIKINLAVLTLLVLAIPISINAALNQVRIAPRAYVATPPTPPMPPSPSPLACNVPCPLYDNPRECGPGLACLNTSSEPNSAILKCRNPQCPTKSNCVCPSVSPKPSPSVKPSPSPSLKPTPRPSFLPSPSLKPTPRPSLPPSPSPKPINNPPLIITTKLPNARVNRNYSNRITGIDLDKNDSLLMIAANLPQGINLTGCRQIKTPWAKYIYCSLQGKATKSGTFPITITLQDSQGIWDQKILPLTVNR